MTSGSSARHLHFLSPVTYGDAVSSQGSLCWGRTHRASEESGGRPTCGDS